MVDINYPPLLADLLRQSLQQGQAPQLEVTSNSMAPLLRRGDKVILEAVTPEQLTRGDVITLVSPKVIMTHRYWGTTSGQASIRLLTRGDRPLVLDEPWPLEAIIGRMVGRCRQEKDLRLTSGAGRWLNRHLYWLAEKEFQWWGNRAVGTVATRRTMLQRGVRGMIYVWATIITDIVGRVA